MNAAIRSNLRLPVRHANGNPVDKHGRPIDYFSVMEKKTFEEFMSQMGKERVEFFAMEWDFPAADILADVDAEIFTVLRDPIERTISNMKMDAAFGWGAPFVDVATYLDGSAPFRSKNYYTKFLSGSAWKGAADESSFRSAIHIIAGRIKYCFCDEDVGAFLRSEVGMPIEFVERENMVECTEEWRRHTEASQIRFEFSSDDYFFFYKENWLDYALMRTLRERRRHALLGAGDRGRRLTCRLPSAACAV